MGKEAIKYSTRKESHWKSCAKCGNPIARKRAKKQHQHYCDWCANKVQIKE